MQTSHVFPNHLKFRIGDFCQLDLFSVNKYSLREFLYVRNNYFVEASVLFLREKYAWKLRKMKYERNVLIKNII